VESVAVASSVAIRSALNQKTGSYLITCYSEDDPGITEVLFALFEDGFWDIGTDDDGDAICILSKNVALLAWSNMPAGFQP
jgi:hypothetical protein